MLVVLDFGGGTVDWACLCIDEKGRPGMIAELPSGSVTAAGAHVDAGLLDAMMLRIGEEQRKEVQQRRAQVLEQIRQMKESQNGRANLSGDEGFLEVQLGSDPFIFPREVFASIVCRTAVDQAVEGIGGYMKKVAGTARERNKDLWWVMAGGTRLLAGLEERVKERIMEIGKESGVAMHVASIAQADFATVRGAVLRGVPTRQINVAIKSQPERRSSSVDVPENFVLIRGGEFTMGSPESEAEGLSDETQHQVKVSDFYLSKYAVTQAECKSITGINPSRFKGENLPVENVSWDDCEAFIEALNRKMSKTYRLPTEAEWEYACRAGTTTPFNTGGNLTTEQANYNGNYPYNNNRKGQYREKTVAVDSYAPNDWGLYNMHGNVWEWCSDWYLDIKMGRVVKNRAGVAFGGISINLLSASGSYRVLRGGSWRSNAGDCRSAYRGYDANCNNVSFRLVGTPDYRYDCVGFRLVFVP
ncbi:MAG: formylglycine-generating enzyme family protein [Chlorobiaceae bacterium]|nr:formylglycine-generating enzyme family protein [Chlorobiaceae bacterium]